MVVKSNIVSSLNKQVNKIKQKNKTGIIKATLLVKRASLKMTPVDTGNLRGSAYSTIFKTVKGYVGEIGYTAAYASAVHETKRAYRKAGTSWKFLEKALKQNRKKILQIIRQETKI
jgi:hypothetical protein